jgi:hypothetical protein
MKFRDIFTKLNMENGTDCSMDFFIVNSFFENYKLFIESVFPKVSYQSIKIILENTKPVHYARILSYSDFKEYEQFFLEHNYKIKQSFRSCIIEKYLKEKYLDNSVVVDIKKIIDQENKEIELFLINDSLDLEEINKENILLRHFAIEVNEPTRDELKKTLMLNGFKDAGGGSNKEEKSSTLYYEKIDNRGKMIRLELFKKD